VTAIDPARAADVGQALLTFLRKQPGNERVSFAEEPSAVGDGWETYIYGFRLDGAPDAAWSAPLIVRFPSNELAWRAEQEAAVQRFAAERGIRTPLPLAVDAEGAALGLPCVIMERFGGRTVLDLLSENPLAGRKLIPPMAELQATLHRLPIEGCPLPSDGTLADRQFEGFRARIEYFGLSGLSAALEWLEANASRVSDEEAVLCHGDFHPNNVMASDDGELCLIDWARSALGDRHHDIAATLTIMRAAPIVPRNFIEGLLDRFGRRMFIRRYLGAYRKELPIDKARLRYWEALETFEWMVRVGMTEKLGGAAYLHRADGAMRFPPGYVERLRKMFWQYAKG